MALEDLDPDEAIPILASLVEGVLRFFGRDIEPNPKAAVTKLITAMLDRGLLPENVADAAYFVSARRNRSKRIHPVGVGMSLRSSMGHAELASLLACVSEVIAWGTQQPEWHAFSRDWRSAARSATGVVASNPLDDWAFCDIGPASLDEIPAIVELDRAAFGKEDLVPEHVFAAWQEHDPEAFTCARQASVPLAGYYATLWMKPSALDRFLQGSVREKDLSPADLCTDAEKSAVRAAYVFSIVVNTRATSVTPLLLGHLIGRIRSWAMHRGLERLYAIAATPEGRRLIERRLRFECIDDGAHRSDHHPLYELRLDAVDWTALPLWTTRPAPEHGGL